MKTLKQLLDLQGRVALITGGAGHIGKAIGEALAEQGASLVVLDSNEGAVMEWVKEVEMRYGVRTAPLIMDLIDEEAIRKVPERVKEALGRLDIVVHCAALVGTSDLKGWAVPFKDQSVETWRKALEVNLTAVFSLTQACAELLTVSGHGSVINIISTYGIVGPQMALYEGTKLGNPAAYAASKGGLLQLTRWLATVLAPHVRVNAITPGGVLRGHTDPFLTRYVERTPLKRMATEEDFKGAAVYLASDASSYVTGHNLVVDGGWTAW